MTRTWYRSRDLPVADALDPDSARDFVNSLINAGRLPSRSNFGAADPLPEQHSQGYSYTNPNSFFENPSRNRFPGTTRLPRLDNTPSQIPRSAFANGLRLDSFPRGDYERTVRGRNSSQWISDSGEVRGRSVPDFNEEPYSIASLFDETPPENQAPPSAEPTSRDSRRTPTGRPMAAALGAAAIQGGSNLLGSVTGGIFGLLGARERNAAVAELAARDREFKERQALQSQSFTRDLREDQYSHVSQQSAQEYNQQLGLESNRNDLQRNMFDYQLAQKQEALKQAGLPAYLAQMPGTMPEPRVSQRMVGGRLYTSQLAGDPTTSSWNSSPTQQLMGWGKLPSQYSSLMS
jgi:hypothetical protein